jgi:hypothetical protein
VGRPSLSCWGREDGQLFSHRHDAAKEGFFLLPSLVSEQEVQRGGPFSPSGVHFLAELIPQEGGVGASAGPPGRGEPQKEEHRMGREHRGGVGVERHRSP